MTAETKTIIIQDLQCKHSSWLNSFVSKLSTGSKCTDSLFKDNIMITNLIKVVYRYNTWETETEPDDLNCLTEDEICNVICKARTILKNCNC